MKLLHIDASITGEQSASRGLSAAIVQRLRDTIPELDIVYRDLDAAPLPHLCLANLPASHPIAASLAGALGAQARLAMDDSQAVLDEFLAADIVVIGAPMYNFTIPSQLKAWVDRILVPGQTFSYGANGVQGLAGGKRAILAVSRGGMYGPGSPAAAAEHGESYLRAALGFIGIAEPQVVVAEGLQMGADRRAQAMEEALRQAQALA
ncbi:FMN-dependent NADH-azoreductase [Bordetella bronchialis]|uniref:FMN dependent NADH:quinone oxidoreductase n=1 Tax=Bordetella bronchialis TaxID=463025 RepID=A0A193FXN3_9BORD|nr:NAD(P)H-dependent oxidoreductase [Bordetella bronchialis]ANN72527.1 FMN-dependent NADH-azoreductase [Bordetella bronchialis]